MKVTALIPDELVEEVKKLAKGKNLTDSLIIALKEWTASKKIKKLNKKLAKNPLSFHADFSAEDVRKLNRK